MFYFTCLRNTSDMEVSVNLRVNFQDSYDDERSHITPTSPSVSALLHTRIHLVHFFLIVIRRPLYVFKPIRPVLMVILQLCCLSCTELDSRCNREGDGFYCCPPHVISTICASFLKAMKFDA